MRHKGKGAEVDPPAPAGEFPRAHKSLRGDRHSHLTERAKRCHGGAQSSSRTPRLAALAAVAGIGRSRHSGGLAPALAESHPRPPDALPRAAAHELRLSGPAHRFHCRPGRVPPAFVAARAVGPNLSNPAWLLVAALLVVRLLRTLVIATWVSPRITPSGPIFLLVAAAGLLLWIVRRSWYRAAMRGMRWALVMLGFSIFWIMPELVVMAFHSEPHETPGFSHPVQSQPQQRIVWLLFDEASYDQLFDHRQPAVDFPQFETLARTSVSFSQVRPAGYFTEEVIPSLLQGEHCHPGEERSERTPLREDPGKSPLAPVS